MKCAAPGGSSVSGIILALVMIFLVSLLSDFRSFYVPYVHESMRMLLLSIIPRVSSLGRRMMENSTIYTKNLYTNSMLPDEKARCLF